MRSTTSARIRPSQRQGLPVAADAIARVPAAAVGFPGHSGVAADFGDVQIALARGWFGGKVERLSLDVRPGRQHRRQASPVCGARGTWRASGLRSRSCRRLSAFRDLSSPRPLVPRPAACADHDVFRRAGGHDVAALVARLGPHVDDPVGRLDHVQIVLDHHHRVAQVDQPVEHVQQLGQIVEVQAGGRLVEQVERPAGVGPGQLGGQLDALRLAAGERRRRLAERQIVEPHVAQRLQTRRILGMFSNSSHRLAARHVEHVGDRLAVIADGQRLGVVAPAAARVALDPHVGQEVHLDAQLAVAFAFLAAAAGHVEAEPPRRVAAQLGLGQLGIKRADQVEHAGVRGRVRGGRLPSGC